MIYWLCRCVGFLLIVSAIDKWFLVENLTHIISSYRILLPPWDRVLAFLLPWWELAVGVGLILGGGFWLHLFFLDIALLYLLAVFHLWWMGYEIDCGCFSWLQSRLSVEWHLFFNVLLVAFAVFLLFVSIKKK